jgi:hypothetical protein
VKEARELELLFGKDYNSTPQSFTGAFSFEPAVDSEVSDVEESKRIKKKMHFRYRRDKA